MPSYYFPLLCKSKKRCLGLGCPCTFLPSAFCRTVTLEAYVLSTTSSKRGVFAQQFLIAHLSPLRTWTTRFNSRARVLNRPSLWLESLILANRDDNRDRDKYTPNFKNTLYSNMVPRLPGLRRLVATQISLQIYGKLDFKLQDLLRVNP